MSLRVETVIDAPVDVVWAHLEDIASHVEWMADAVSIEFLAGQRRGTCSRPYSKDPLPRPWRLSSTYRGTGFPRTMSTASPN